MKNTDFLVKLQAEAEFQAKLHTHRWLPESLDWMTSLVGRYSWQVLGVAAAVTAGVLEVLR